MYLVLNLGLKSIRAIVFNEAGKILSNKSLPLATILNGSNVEQNGTEWWDKSVQVVKEALQNDNIRNQISYITVTASSCCVLAVNDNGEPLFNVIMVSDKRAGNESQEISNTVSFADIKQRRPELFINSSLMLPKVLWIKKNEPDIYTRAKYFLSPNDYFCYRMTGQAVTDCHNAEKSFYDNEKESYPLELFQEIDISIDKFPCVKEVGYVVSQVTRTFKNLIGISSTQSVKYVVSTYDAICAFYGSGASKNGDACDVSGTVTSLRVLAAGKKPIDSKNIFSQYQKEFNISIIGGSNNLGGGLIEWAKQAFYSEHKKPYELMESEAKDIGKGADGVIFLPFLMGERAPLWNDDARGVFFGLARNHNRKHLIRAVFESSGFSLRTLMEEIEGAGEKIKAVRFSGGLSRIHLIARIKADIVGKEIHIVEEFETTALGAFMLMAISTGVFNSLKDASKVVTISEIIFPNKEAHEKYTAIYGLYKNIYLNLVECFRVHKNLHSDDIYRSSEKIENM